MSEPTVLSILTDENPTVEIYGGAIRGGKKRKSRKSRKGSKKRKSRSKKRKSRKGSKKRKSRSKKRKSRSRKGSTTKSAPISVSGTFEAYDVAKGVKVPVKDPKLIKMKSSRGDRAMIQGISPKSGNKVTTFVSTSDSRVSKHF